MLHLCSDWSRSSPVVSLATVLCLIDLLDSPEGGMDSPLLGAEAGVGGMESPLVGIVVRLDT